MIAAAGMVKAAHFLVSKYTLVATNVPYLGNRRQNRAEKYSEDKLSPLKADLASFVERSFGFLQKEGTLAQVTHNIGYFIGVTRLSAALSAIR